MAYEDDHGDEPPLAPSKARQWNKILQIKDALVASGFTTLDDQARALGVSRSTTWAILQHKHKSSGLSTATILQMLSRANLPPLVRARLLEYIDEKLRGLYADKPYRLRQFNARLERQLRELSKPLPKSHRDQPD